MNKLLCILSLTLLTMISCQSSTTDPEKDKLIIECDKFMNTFSKGQFTQAVEQLKQSSLLGTPAVDSLKVTVSEQMKGLDSRYGKIKSYSFINEKSIKDLVTQRIYLLQFEGYYLKFQFTMYKSSFGWKIVGFEYNENIEDLLKQ